MAFARFASKVCAKSAEEHCAKRPRGAGLVGAAEWVGAKAQVWTATMLLPAHGLHCILKPFEVPSVCLSGVPPPPPPPQSLPFCSCSFVKSDGPMSAPTTGTRCCGYPSRGRCYPDEADAPLPTKCVQACSLCTQAGHAHRSPRHI